ncbi:hypothetical protein M5D96_004000, partial [Drosophila gunungcola]
KIVPTKNPYKFGRNIFGKLSAQKLYICILLLSTLSRLLKVVQHCACNDTTATTTTKRRTTTA